MGVDAVTEWEQREMRTSDCHTHADPDRPTGSGQVFGVPRTNHWYVTTEEGITLGPYRRHQEAKDVLGLLRHHARRRRLRSASKRAERPGPVVSPRL